eukprot:symbB.v1.2.018403.t2/scaffold1435.1/size118962/8
MQLRLFRLQKILKTNGVDISGCTESQNLPSGQGMVMLDAEGGASSVVVGGANTDWTTFDLTTLETTLKGASVLLLQQEIPEKINLAAAKAGKAQGVLVIQDVGGEDRPISSDLLAVINFLCPNEGELQRLTGMPTSTRDEVLAAAETLVEKGPSVLVTLGERGAMLVTTAETIEVDPFPVPRVVDGTAAGDAFRAALAVALAEKQVSDLSCDFTKSLNSTTCRQTLREALRLASAAGALAVSRQGAEPSLPWRKDCAALLLDLWDGPIDTLGLIARQGQVQGLGMVYLNFPQHLEGRNASEVLSALETAGLKAGGIALRFPEDRMSLGALTNPSIEVRREAVELTKDACHWATSLGANEVVWPQTDGYDYQLQVDYISAWSLAVEAFREVLDSSACRDKKVSLEFKATDEISRFAIVPSTGAALLFVREVQGKLARPSLLRLTLDVGHLLMAGENPAQSVAMAGAAGKLFGIHLNDGHSRLGAEDGLAFASVHGTGSLELVLWLQRLGYEGRIYFDTFPKNEDPVKEAELNIRRFLKLWEKAEKMDEKLKKLSVASMFWQERPTLPSRIKVEPVRKAAARKAVAKPTPKTGLRRPGGASPRREVPAREGALYVHSREPLLGDPMVAIRVIEAVEQRVICRALCSGRITEVKASNLQPLDVRPLRASSSIAALTAFEELFFVGDPEELTQEQSSFGIVQLGQLSAQKLSDYLVDSYQLLGFVPGTRHAMGWLPWLAISSALGFESLQFPEEAALAHGKTALVTGAAGFIGSHVARHCRDLGMTVLALDDLSGGFAANVPQGVTFIEGDIRDAELLDGIFRQYEVQYVYHLAAYAAEGLSHFIRSYNYRTNLVGSVEILNQAIKHHVHCFVFTSSIAVYGSINDLSQMQNPNRLKEEDRPTPEDPYGIAKYAFELDLHAAKELFGIDFVIFRPHNVYGPHQNMFDKYRNVVGIFINQIFHGQPMTIFGNGEQVRAFSYIDDVAPIIARGPLNLRARNEIFNVGADVPYTVNEWQSPITTRSKITLL